jgi:hypothetical protein
MEGCYSNPGEGFFKARIYFFNHLPPRGCIKNLPALGKGSSYGPAGHLSFSCATYCPNQAPWLSPLGYKLGYPLVGLPLGRVQREKEVRSYILF